MSENTNMVQEQERKLKLWEILIKIIQAFKSSPSYEMLKEAVDEIKDVLDEFTEEHEDTRRILDELIESSTVLGENINTLSADEVAKEIEKISVTLKETNLEYKLQEELLDENVSKDIILTKDKEGNVYIVDNKNVLAIKLKEDLSGFTLNAVNNIKPEELEVIKTKNFDDMKKQVVAEFLPQIDNSDYAKQLRSDLERLQALQIDKLNLQKNLNELHTDKNGHSTVLLENGTFCVIHKEENEMIMFNAKDGKITAELYTECDLSDKGNPKPLGRSYVVGEWENENNTTKSVVRFNQSGTVKEMFGADKITEYFKMNGLSSEAVKLFLRDKNEVLQNFGKVTDKEKSDKLKEFVEFLTRELPDCTIGFSDADTSYINVINNKTGEELIINYSDEVSATPLHTVPTNIAYRHSESEIAEIIEKTNKIEVTNVDIGQTGYKYEPVTVGNKDANYNSFKAVFDDKVNKYSQELAEKERKAREEQEKATKQEEQKQAKADKWKKATNENKEQRDYGVEM